METGLKVTLRGNRMYEFLDRMITLAFPRVKDFRGVDPKGFDKSGNYNFGFNEQTVFPEVDAAAVTFPQGMNITIVSTAQNAEEGRELLSGFGFPFKTPEANLFHLRAGMTLDERWEFSVFVENLFDEEYYTSAADNFGLSGFRLKPHPRVWGGTLSFNF